MLWQIWGVLMLRKLNFCWRLFDLLYYAISGPHPSEIPTFMAYFVYYMVLTHFDSKDDYRTGCRNVSHCQQKFYSEIRYQPDDHAQPTYEMTPGFKPFTEYEVIKICFLNRFK